MHTTFADPMPTDWKHFEELISEIQRETAEEAKVTRNEKVRGHSGRPRQLDVVIRRKVGLHSVLIVIECKHQSRPVSISQVEAFVTKLHDVDASEGVIVSTSGFGDGARAQAARHGVRLQNYREALETDWKAVVGNEAWITFVLTSIPHLRVTSHTPVGIRTTLHADTAITIPDGTTHRLVDLFFQAKTHSGIGDRPGQYAFGLEFSDGVQIESSDGMSPCHGLEFEFTQAASEHIVNLELNEGEILENDAGDPLYRKVITKSIEWEETIKSRPGRKLTAEEFDAFIHGKEMNFAAPVAALQRYLRLVITNFPDQTPPS